MHRGDASCAVGVRRTRRVTANITFASTQRRQVPDRRKQVALVLADFKPHYKADSTLSVFVS